VSPRETSDSSEGTFNVTLRCVLALLPCSIALFQLASRQSSPTRRGSVCHTPSVPVLLKYSSPNPPLRKNQTKIDRIHRLRRDVPTLCDTSFFTLCFPLHFASVTVYLPHTLPLTHADIKTITTAISMTMTSPGQRISSSDFVDVEIPHAAGAVQSQQSRAPMSTAHLE
jgi:hypothetical protein